MPCVRNSAPPRFDSGSRPLYFDQVCRFRPAMRRSRLDSPRLLFTKPWSSVYWSESSRSLTKLALSTNCAWALLALPPLLVNQVCHWLGVVKATTPLPGPATSGYTSVRKFLPNSPSVRDRISVSLCVPKAYSAPRVPSHTCPPCRMSSSPEKRRFLNTRTDELIPIVQS